MQQKKLKIKRKNKSYSIKDCALYNINSKRRLAEILYTDLSTINKLKADAGNYEVFRSNNRLIEKPTYQLDLVHTRIASLLSRVAQPNYMHSGLKKRSYLTNATTHLGCHPVLVTDIKSFFPSTSREKVFKFFYKILHCSADIADMLSHICTIDEHIPTGSRISMPLAYWANKSMFDELYHLATRNNVNMTVYVDDVTFSGSAVNKLFQHKVNIIIEAESHIMHPKKTILYNKDQVKVITGVIVKKDTLKVRNKHHQIIHSEMELWQKATNEQEKKVVQRKLYGRMIAAATIEKKFRDKAKSLG